MDSNELQLFNKINNARADNGCAPLKRSTSLTRSSEAEAKQRAADDTLDDGNTSSKAAAGGDNWSADRAFDRMMSQNKPTLLNCGLTTMSVGRGTATYERCTLFLICSDRTRVGWVATFR
ncbi:hypothetical protein E1261_44870 [Kribbella albertanoniae]|uniref:SCP domain-containing protein n=2 Tax=Kribbella albertanoniae TaxID=1266829 RepID=A0A4R4NYI4_9ACTN|nr:hypothetical protein E1261_44870 [Kribbella albertanoniae]